MKYTSKFFKDSYPDWKRRKDAIPVRYFYRPLSFYGAAWAANRGLTANQVSYFSSALAVTACALYLVNSFPVRVFAAVLFSVWLLLDCVDGNLARGIKKLPFGEFADSMSSYLLVGLMGAAFGLAAYQEGGVLVPAGNPWMIVAGALASNGDSLMRLIYQKYKSLERELADAGRLQIENDVYKNTNDVGNVKVRIGAELGVGGIVPLLVLLATVFRAPDLMVFYCLFYYGGACVVNILLYARRAIRRERKIVAKESALPKPEK